MNDESIFDGFPSRHCTLAGKSHSKLLGLNKVPGPHDWTYPRPLKQFKNVWQFDRIGNKPVVVFVGQFFPSDINALFYNKNEIKNKKVYFDILNYIFK